MQIDELKLCGGPFCTHKHISSEASEVRAHETRHYDSDHRVHSFEKAMEGISPIVLHRDGLNVRHLGAIRMLCTNPDAKRLILTECVSRCLKTELEARMRLRMRTLGTPADAPFKQDVVAVLNLCCCGVTNENFCEVTNREAELAAEDWSIKTPAQLRDAALESAELEERRAARFWRCSAIQTQDLAAGQGKYGDFVGVSMKAALSAKFGECLTQDELSAGGGDLREYFDIQAATWFALERCGVILSAKAYVLSCVFLFVFFS
jgi:hypothetical protein